LAIRATVPLINTNEILVGTLSAGYLLNNNNAAIIDKITGNTELVSSIFLGDMRVCSNVPPRNKENVVGSKLDGQAATYILNGGKNYIGRMLVGGKRYLSGYVPLGDSENNIIGILGIGIPEKRIFALRDKLISIFFLAAFLSTILALIFGLLRGKSIVNSIDELRMGIEAFSRDDFDYRIKIRSKDEIEELANFFNKVMAQLKTARRKLTEHEKMVAMGRMATAITHGLRNTFAEIQMGADYLKNKVGSGSPELNAALKNIENSIIYATNVLNHILRFSHPKAPLMVDTDINLIIEDVLSGAELRRSLEDNKIELIKELDSSIPQIKGDGIQIKEAILNLVNNAIEAMPAGGKLSIVTKKLPDSLILKVIDTGCGIPKETMDNLFTPFFTTKGTGLGLGLSILQEIIEAHQGNIEVNTEINKGTAFIVTLPLERLA
jgi:signal transduction histidine kinase